jgi:hypothetical protein
MNLAQLATGHSIVGKAIEDHAENCRLAARDILAMALSWKPEPIEKSAAGRRPRASPRASGAVAGRGAFGRERTA